MNWKRSPWITVLLLLAGAALCHRLPSLERFRASTPAALHRALTGPWLGRPATPLLADQVGQPDQPVLALLPPPAAAAGSQPGKAPARPSGGPAPLPDLSGEQGALAAPVSLLEDSGESLAHFRKALSRGERGKGVVRVVHFGDSPVTGDLITGEARARFHRDFGDGGHGWILPGRPWEWYGHLGVEVEGKGWRIHSPALTQRKDRLYGLAAVSFTGNGGAWTKVSTARNMKVSRMDIHYLAGPRAGSLLVTVDKEEPVEVSTRAAEPGLGVQRVPLGADGSHTITLRTKGDGEVVLYGLSLERDQGGVVYDALGSNGGTISQLSKVDEAQWIQALKLRQPDLVVLAFGTNETGYFNVPGKQYFQDYRDVVQRIRTAVPYASILIMAPMDRGERQPGGGIGTMPSLMNIVEAQRRVAQELRCAFFNTFLAMGGEGSAARWYQASPKLMTGDYTHPTRTGADRIARLLVEALEGNYSARREEGPSGVQKDGAVGEAGAKCSQHH